MPLQFYPIVFGCVLLVAFGTLVYTYVTSGQLPQAYGPKDDGTDDEKSPPPIGAPLCGMRSSRRKKEPDTCAICLTLVNSDFKKLTCEHIFHSHCINMSSKSNTTCPICRKLDFEEPPLIGVSGAPSISSTIEDGELSRRNRKSDNCSICSTSLKTVSTSKLTCGHIFHSHCVNVWSKSNSTCPNCQKVEHNFFGNR